MSRSSIGGCWTRSHGCAPTLFREHLVTERLRQTIPVAVGLALFAIALAVLRVELRAVSWHELTAAIASTSWPRLGLAIGLTALNYLALTVYDQLAFAYIGKSLPRVRIAIASFLAYTISNTVGFAMLSGASVRYRFYTRWGVTAEELSRIVVSYSTTFWLGLFALGGLSLALSPLPTLRELPAGAIVRATGWVLLAVPAAYLALTMLRRRPLRLRSFELPVPPVWIALGQVLISALDWMLAGAVLYVLLPPGALSFLGFLGIFLAAILIGMVSHVPGGLGVFEGLMVVFLAPYASSGQVLPSLIVFRAVYYLLPFCIGLVGLVADEVRQRRAHVLRAGAMLGRLTEQLTPAMLAAATFAAGIVLLFSSATPAAPGRLALVDRVLPLAVIEASHFLGSVAGAALLVLSQAVARRLNAAYYLASFAIVAGMVTALLKAFDIEEATLLFLLLLVLWRARPAFDRKAAFFETTFSPRWVAALIGAFGASLWLGFFAFKHVEYAGELWWRFELHGEASRFLRASVGAAVALLLFGFARLIGFAPHRAPPPSEQDLADAARAIQAQSSTSPFLVFLRDKSLLFNDDRTAFVMYSVHGRTWVALGDPVGPPDRLTEVIRLFLERCQDFGGVPVFYEVGKSNLHLYADFGLTFVKLGEEARVDLTTFTLAGGHAAKYRNVMRRLEKEGASFRVVGPADVAAVMPQLRVVSDDWLDAKASGEKGFSLGFFDEAYLSRFPVAVIERGGQIQAFANIWPGPQQNEISVDLMRYRRDAPKNVMEALFVHLMQWAHDQGYRTFTLGMAPLSGFERSPVASFWNRMGAFLYEHGDAVYHFQGLRAFKEKFNPIWEPRYLAYAGGFRLALIMADVSALVAGGYRRIFSK
jgi:phosphatidylglycerol lysyltransferase